MRKFSLITALVLVMAMLLGIFAGCGEKAGENEENANTEEVIEVVEIEEVPEFKTTEPMESNIYVKKIDNLSEDFMMGVDISSLIALEGAGAKFYNWDGSAEQDIFTTLAQAGVNTIRVRVWNDPYDENGNGYGGGNCDINTALEIGKRATAAGMGLMVDFHYSDFWADPAKQMVPKAWADIENRNDLTNALYEYTRESLLLLRQNGVNVVAVQVGNETTSGMAGVTTSWSRVCKMCNAGSKAVREVYPEAKVVVHFTNPNTGNLPEKADSLAANEVDYDVFASSFYPSMHGTLDNLSEQFEYIINTYGKEVMIAETSWPFTTEDGDGWGNTLNGGSMYPTSVQGQSNELVSVIECMANLGDKAIGVFYWEAAWIPVNNTAGLQGSDWEAKYAANQKLWEENGIGWAASYAGEYDAEDAGQWYGGCACENQALFDYNGVPLESLKTFGYVYCGTTAEVELSTVEDVVVEVQKDKPYTLPETVDGRYNDLSMRPVKVEWNADEAALIDTSKVADYVVTGTLENGDTVTITVLVRTINLLDNPGFEDGSLGWTVESSGAQKQIDKETPRSDTYCMHFWDASDKDIKFYQNVTVKTDGTYRFGGWLQGGEDTSYCKQAYVYVTVNGETIKTNFEEPMTGWKQWSSAYVSGLELKAGDTVEVGCYVSYAAKGWGTLDDFEFSMI